MQKIILDTAPISMSGNIALYPSLAINNVGRLGIAWYEYGSPYETDRSDIWLSLQDTGGMWAEPVNVSGGISYNNGPCLIWEPQGEGWCCAWHSWRSPGKEPFIVDGDVTNIWLCAVSVNGAVQQSFQAIPGISNTEYASLAPARGEGAQLLYYDRVRRVQCLAQAGKQTHFSAGIALPASLSTGQFGDLAFGLDGTMWITYVGEGGGIYLASRTSAGCWSQPYRIDESHNSTLTRPKLSLCSKGAVWVACHSNTWGKRVTRYRVRTAGSQLVMRLESDYSPGNHCWTCNAISVRGAGGERSFSFGPDVFARSSDVTAVMVEHCLYDQERGYGFDRLPRSQLRKLGDELTRGLFYDDKPATFRVDLPSGEYEVEVAHSSWVAPTSGTSVFFEGEVLDSQLPPQEHDAVFVLRVEPDSSVQCMIVSTGGDYDENRPSKVVHDVRTNLKHLAWTCYGPQKVEIVYASFDMP